MEEENSAPAASPGEVTRLVARLSAGDAEAGEELLSTLYSELRRLAASYMSGRQDGHTLQPTAVVHEAWLRLGRADKNFEGRSHFLATAALAMRHVLVDHARRKRAAKRFDSADRVTLVDSAGADSIDVEVLALEQALERLRAVNARQEQVVQLRYFGGLTLEEIADVLDTSVRTATRDWRVARLLLQKWLSEDARS